MTLSTTSPGDEREAARTTAIAYPDADLSCGLSTDGILICGDEKSINRVRNALHAESGTVPALRAELLEARAALSSSTVQQVGADDTARLDWLECRINEDGAIHLHDGKHPHGTGLGLRPGLMVRTLRQAIDQAMSKSEQGDQQ